MMLEISAKYFLFLANISHMNYHNDLEQSSQKNTPATNKTHWLMCNPADGAMMQ